MSFIVYCYSILVYGYHKRQVWENIIKAGGGPPGGGHWRKVYSIFPDLFLQNKIWKYRVNKRDFHPLSFFGRSKGQLSYNN